MTDANDAPVFSSPATAEVAENQSAATVVYTAAATDADGDTLSYGLSGTDAGLFTINGTTGAVSFVAPPDFEMPGDDDGDNVYDIIVTASDSDDSTDHNVAITVTDVYEPFALSLLDGSNGFTLNGIAALDSAGTSVASAGDVNGDGYDDLIIGAQFADPNGSNSGETYVVYGGASVPVDENGDLALSSLDGSNGFALNGIDADDQSGFSVSSAGDVNGDGYDDLIIGARWADPNDNNQAGESYVVYGGAGAPGTNGMLDLSALDGSNGFILNGIDASDRSGSAVASAGDVNGDGYDDLIIGALDAHSGANADVGESYVVYGGASAPGTGGVLELSALDGSNGFILTGVDALDNSGTSVSSAGDVNGDGYDDLIIGANNAESDGGFAEGETYVVYGGELAPGTAGVLALSALDGSNGFVLAGIDRSDTSGYSVSSAGDVNGDGYDDLIIGARWADPNGNDQAGESYVVYGGASAPGAGGLLALSALDGTNGFTLNGIDANDRSGISVSSAGDVNGDGYDDLIIGAPDALPGGRNRAGETYVVYGGAAAPGTGGVLELSALDGSNGFALNGIDAFDESGFSASSAGDVNGDGYDDLIIGAGRANPNGSASGETYVVYGGATGTESLAPVTAQGTTGADNFTGNGGGDSFTGIATGDVVRGGAGDDNISVTALDFADIDGGTGRDSLMLAGADLSLDLTGAGNGGVDSVEVVDLSGTGANTLVLDALAVFDLTEERDGGIAGLDVLGDANDRVEFRNSFTSSGTVTEGDTTYTVFRAGNAEVRVQTGVQVQIPLATAPVFSSGATADAAENQSLAYTAVATDADGDTPSYSLSGTDAALFTIDERTGVVSFIAAPDFEMPGDDGNNNVYDITVTASDGSNAVDQAVAITVTNVNDNAPAFTSPDSASVAENQTLAYTAMAADADAGDVVSYSLSGGADAALFTIDANTGEVRFNEAPDFEAPGSADGDNVYNIIVTASDDTAGTTDTDQAVAITVTDANDAPIFSSPATASVAESQSAATVVYTAVATDTDGDTLSYSLSGGADAALFTIDANTGQVRFNEAPDFEAPGSADGDNVYDITVTASDNNAGTPDTDQAVAITVTDANDAPVFSSPASAEVAENQSAATVVYTAMATDADGDTLSYSLSGTDAGLFTINGTTGAVSFVAPPDFEMPGDDDGDNVYDIIVTASDSDDSTDHNVAITVTDVYEPFALSMLSGTNGFILTGIDAFDQSGTSVSSAGDVNGDGYDDLIIGAHYADPNGDRSGETYVVYGGASAPGTDGVLDLSDLDGTNGFILNGIDEVDRSGSVVSSAGDVNGDGYDDLIIGAFSADPNGDSYAGETYLVYGGASAPGTDGVLDLGALDGTNGFILTGIDPSDNSGRSVSSAGDVNGDGYDDLIIGASKADPNGDSDAGETYIVYGGANAPGTNGVLDLGALNGTNGFILAGIDRFDQSGWSVSSAGDVNGDGYDDLAIGANRADPNGNRNAGEIYVIYGGASAPGTGGVLDLGALNGTNGFILNGIDADDQSGWSVSSTGDVNGDGYDDLIIGARFADPNGDSYAGETYIVYGGASAPGTGGRFNLSMLDGSNGFTLNGIDADDQSGYSVSSAGDVNGDGYDDLIIAAREGDPNGNSQAGETYLVYGGASAPGTDGVLDLSALDGSNGFILNGIDEGDQSGFSVSSSGDVNGDGYDDLVIGASGANPNGRSDAGETYVVYGGATGTESLTPVTAQGTTGADNFTGNAGADSFTGIATGDVVRGGAGDDNISVTALDFADIDGGTGRDSLMLDGAGLSLDLTGAGHAGVDSIEVFDLSGTGANTLVLDALAVFDLTEERAGGMATLDVLGDANDTVDLTGANFTSSGTATEDGTTYNVYQDGNAEVRVQTGVQVQFPVTAAPVFTSDATARVAENQTVAYEAQATDEDSDTLSYSLSGTDAALFTIDPSTGVVSFITAPDFENPGDAGADNVYDITVTASDGTNSTDQPVAITVTDEYEPVDLSMLSGTNGFILTGIDMGDQSGRSVSSAGDVNGDGYDDLIIGAYRADPGGDADAGETYVVYGGASAPGTGGVLGLSALDGTNGFILNGIDAADFSGRSVSSAGDVNGDGYDDLIIGADRASTISENFIGETYVAYGGANAPGTNGVLDLSLLDGTNGFILTGTDANDYSGASVSSAGDVNGDGYDDLIIGANGAGSGGETYVVYGGANAPGAGGVLALSALNGTNGFTLTGIDANDSSGRSVSSAGDVNGDGYDDLIIGADGAGPNGNGAGETYVVYGGASAPGTNGVLDLSALDGTNGFILNGIDAADFSGRSVSSAGDVNGDGYDDLIIGAYRGDPGGDTDAGETYIVYGGANAPGTGGRFNLSTLNGTNGFILSGIIANDFSGRSVSSAGDVNGDGYDDLIVGAIYADPNGNSQAGETYVIYGGASAPGTGGVLDLGALDGTNGFILAGIDANDQSGRSVSSAGDVNGDGYDDLIIGAHRGDPNGDASGETYVVYGGATGTESTVAITAQGTAAADNFTGNAGADSFTAIAMNDVVRGGAGDDRISVTALDFAAIDGGTGQDTLVLDGAGLSLDLTGAGHAGVDSVEVFDLSGTGANTLVLDALAVFDLTEERAGGMATLDVLGDANDTVDLTGANFTSSGTATEDGTTYNVYQDGNAEVRVQTGVQVQFPVTAAPVFTSDATARVAENQTVAYEAQATDEDSDTLNYSLSGTDAALFTIDPTTGVVSFTTAPDFENPGDAGADNVYDITVTASDGTNTVDQTVAITVTDEYEPVPLSTLDGTNGFILNGIDLGDFSGISVSSAGDVNGDGYDDLIIGARNADPNGPNSGETYVVYGGASAPGTGGRLNLSTLDGTGGFILNGIDTSDNSGASVSSAGDVNDDGYDDLIIGARNADPNGDRSGEAYLVYGGANAPLGGALDLSMLDGSNGFILTGIDRFDYSGRSVSSAGDVNGDGYDDLIIGANRADPGGDTDAGETYLVYGGASAPGTSGVLNPSMLDGSNGFILNGIDRNDNSGFSVSSAGDVNGDGYDDLIIGAYGAAPNGGFSGETYVVYGGASAPGTGGRFNLSTLNGTNGFILNGIDVGDLSGWSVSSAGDVNGDGYDDLIIGARSARPNGDRSGETYVVYGGASAPGTGGRFNLSTLNGTNGFILNGIDAEDYSGFSVSSAGDVNGDGYDDLIIGARYADPNGNSSAGETYLVYGGASAPGTGGALDLSDLDGTNGFTLNGIDANDLSGESVSSAGDVNGDGYDDLIIGATRANPNGAISGETYVVYGGATGTESLTPVTAQGTAAADNFTGNAGADSFTGIATGDVVRGGAGDDRISVTALDFAAIDGGTGQDTLLLDGAGLSLDLTGAGHAGVDSIEVFDLTGTGANTLALDAQAVFDLTEERAGGMATLDVLVDDNDTVDLSGGNFSLSGTETEDGTTYNVYQDGNAEVRVQIQTPAPTLIETIELSMLDGSNGFTLNGIDMGDESGFSVSSAGDVNGDGYDDLIIGARYADPSGDNSGETYVVYGGASAPGTDGVLELSTLDGTNGFILNGIDELDASGNSVSSAGDINGDGYGDLIIGAWAADPNGTRSGETYVVYGGASAPGTGGVLELSDLDGANGFTLNGIDADDESGRSVSSAGDFNGDGYDDLIIGASQVGSSYINYITTLGAGESYVVYGGPTGTDLTLNRATLDGSNGFTLTGADTGDLSGRSISSAGDVNGDGYDDLIIGAHQGDSNGEDSGEAYVVYGGASAPGTSGVLALSALNGSNGFTINGIDANDRSGYSVSSAGDVNGDGYDDLIIGAYAADPNGNNSGETYVVYGGASAPGTDGVLDLSMLNGTNGFILTGIDANDQSGYSVSSAGDVNGDGYDDLIIGARYADPNGSYSGETYVLYGGASAPGTAGVLALSSLDGTNGFTLNGIDAVDQSSISVSSAGDVNGDGYDDLIIGARGGDPNGDSDAGESYVIYGGATGTESLAPVTAQGTAAADNFTGNAGADSFTGIATGDVVRGGAGDDRISVTALDFAAIDGGTGQDTLLLDGAGLSLDPTGAGHAGVDSIEVFDLTGTGANTLVLDAQAVFDLTEERAGGTATLDVLGDADDRVDLSGGNFALSGTATEDGTTYNVYQDGNAELRVQNGVPVSLGTTSSGLLSEDPDSAAMPASLAPDLSRLDALMDNGLWNDQWDGLNSLDKPDRHRLNEEPMFEDLSVRDSIPDMQDTGEDAVVLMPLPVPALTPMAAPVFAGDKPLQNDLAMILQDMEVFADPVNNGDTDMDGF